MGANPARSIQGEVMGIELRRAVGADAEGCARIIYEAFKGIADRHGFPPAFPSLEVALRVANLFLGLPTMYGLVAVSDNHVVGAVFLDEGDPIRAVAIVAVDPAAQRRGLGRTLMQAALERARGATGVRLVQEAYNTQAMGLYASLGFAVKEPLVRIAGRPRSGPAANVEIRRLTAQDLEDCERLCRRVHGITRTDDLRDALRLFAPFACARGGRITAYSYAVFAGILAWGVAETEEDMKALLLGIAADVREPLAFHLPIRQAGFLRWCLDEGLRIEKPLTLMAIGEYHEPRGSYFPSGFY
jgi:ribosomal protein S18 acetylase RimI-like enzyme